MRKWKGSSTKQLSSANGMTVYVHDPQNLRRVEVRIIRRPRHEEWRSANGMIPSGTAPAPVNCAVNKVHGSSENTQCKNISVCSKNITCSTPTAFPGSEKNFQKKGPVTLSSPISEEYLDANTDESTTSEKV